TFADPGDASEFDSTGFLFGIANATSTPPAVHIWGVDVDWVPGGWPAGTGMAFSLSGEASCSPTDVSFLAISPTSGVVPAGGSTMATFTFTAGATTGTEIDAVCLTSTSPDAYLTE